MSTRVRTACTDCGWTGRPSGYRSQAQADFAYRQHSCEKTRRDRAAYRRGLARETSVDRTPKPCHHPRANHQHGHYATYVHDRCRCLPCSAAASTYDTDLARQKAYGRSNYTDAEPVRQHVRELSAAGVGLKRITALTGINGGVLAKLMYGSPRPDGTRRPPAARIRNTTAAAILAVRTDQAADGAVIDSTGTRRRLQALITLGWSVSRLATHSGVDRQSLDATLTGHDITAGRARAIRALYDELWDQAPPENNQRERIAATRSRRRAQAMSWAPPLAWDDDTIDDPDALPAHLAEGSTDGVDHAAIELAVTGTPVHLNRAERWIAVERLATQGLSDLAIAQRVGVSDKTVLLDRQKLGIDSNWNHAA